MIKLSRRYERGITLIEVIVSIGLVGTLLVGVMMAFVAHARQIRSSQLRLEAIGKLDAFLATAILPDGRLQVPNEGRLDQKFGWRSYIVPGSSVSRLGIQVQRIETFSFDQPTETVCVLDLVVPKDDQVKAAPRRQTAR